MRLQDFASAEEDLALWKLISDSVLTAVLKLLSYLKRYKIPAWRMMALAVWRE
jgi:hypothetical protein